MALWCEKHQNFRSYRLFLKALDKYTKRYKIATWNHHSIKSVGNKLSTNFNVRYANTNFFQGVYESTLKFIIRHYKFQTMNKYTLCREKTLYNINNKHITSKNKVIPHAATWLSTNHSHAQSSELTNHQIQAESQAHHSARDIMSIIHSINIVFMFTNMICAMFTKTIIHLYKYTKALVRAGDGMRFSYGVVYDL